VPVRSWRAAREKRRDGWGGVTEACALALVTTGGTTSGGARRTDEVCGRRKRDGIGELLLQRAGQNLGAANRPGCQGITASP
jgi:hypothetical protein